MRTKLTPGERIPLILEAAAREFLERGYERTSMERIARRARLTKGGLYHHFSGKEEILFRAFESFGKPVRDLVEECRSASSGLAGLRLFLHRYLAYWDTHPRELTFYFLTMVKAYGNRELTAMYGTYAEEMIAFFCSLLERAEDAGELRVPAPRSLAVALLSALDGGVSYLLFDSHLNHRSMAADFERVFLEPYLPAPRR